MITRSVGRVSVFCGSLGRAFSSWGSDQNSGAPDGTRRKHGRSPPIDTVRFPTDRHGPCAHAKPMRDRLKIRLNYLKDNVRNNVLMHAPMRRESTGKTT